MSLPQGRIHLVGAGGAGMSAIAKLLLGRGHQLSGSDLKAGAALEALADLDIETYVGHHPEAVDDAALVVASSAVPDYDEELEAARHAGIPVWRRPELLEAITAEQPSIGVTGTHGKTTTTAMLITILSQLGEDPSFVVGGDLVDVGTNGHAGNDDLLVLEADEAFRTFESLHLRGLVVTNVEYEHVDHFDSADDLVLSFINVADRVDGPVVACLDDPGSGRVGSQTGAITYGLDADADWRISELSHGSGSVSFRLDGPHRTSHVSVLQPGTHVALNAAGALALVSELGRDLNDSAEALAAFRGVGRRWEHKGTVDGVMLYDDYAHHPTEVTAVLAAARSAGPGRLWAVFQPHLYSRTERFASEFGRALAAADVVVVTDVFGAREEPVPGITGELVADAARKAGAVVHYVPHRLDLAEFLAPRVESGDLVISLGAGDITLLHTELVPLLGTLGARS
ncbi:MAG TPA: UDP-N-acetylmuramate--L-alanine ligase [Acidimicrobiia bacterium]|nr:UDP-N-acetylmuramate--L-alanine ligase [Acidimicrobiia bacterium]